MSRKIPKEYDHPIDNILINWVEVLNPYFKKLHFTPNGITLISLILGTMSIICFIKKQFILSGITLFISYFFDCMDGNYARKYNMQTKFGDKFDHYKDWLINGILVLLILFNNKTSFKFKIVTAIVLSITMFGMIIHTGCTEKYIRLHKSSDNKIENSAVVQAVTVCPDIKFLKKFKNLGCGSWYICLSVIIILHKYVQY